MEIVTKVKEREKAKKVENNYPFWRRKICKKNFYITTFESFDFILGTKACNLPNFKLTYQKNLRWNRHFVIILFQNKSLKYFLSDRGFFICIVEQKSTQILFHKSMLQYSFSGFSLRLKKVIIITKYFWVPKKVTSNQLEKIL